MGPQIRGPLTAGPASPHPPLHPQPTAWTPRTGCLDQSRQQRLLLGASETINAAIFSTRMTATLPSAHQTHTNQVRHKMASGRPNRVNQLLVVQVNTFEQQVFFFCRLQKFKDLVYTVCITALWQNTSCYIH